MLEFFANPGYLAVGGALVSAPIIIHLINRMRFKRLRWAAMEFLLKSQKRNRRRLIIEQILLLMLRCLLVALATLLVSRFLGFSFGMNQAKDTLHVVIVDDTLSMSDQWKEGDNMRTCFQVAKTDVLQDRIVKGLAISNKSDRLMILPLSKVALDKSFQAKTYTRLGDKARMDELKADLEQLEPTRLHVALLPALMRVKEAVKANPESRVIVYILSDYRASDWGLPGGEKLHKELVQIAKGESTEVRLIDTAHPYRIVPGPGGVPLSHDNIGIVDLKAGTRVAGKDMPVSFTATIANYSSREAKVNVAIFDDSSGREMLQLDFNKSMPLKIAAGETNSVSFEMPFSPDIKASEAYFAQISARLESAQRGKLENDGLLEDNVRHATIEIRNKVPVLIIDGEGPRGRAESQDSFFIKKAVMSVPGASYEVVHGDELSGGGPTKVLERSNLLQYPTIFILNVRELTTPKQLANLENYVREGGGVAFFLGPNVLADYYNKNLYKKGKGLFPVPLKETYYPDSEAPPRKPEVTGEDQLLLRDSQYSSLEQFPIFGAVVPEPKFRDFLKDLPIKRYFKVPRSEWRPEPNQVEELATLPNEQPITAFQKGALDIFRSLEKILKNDEYKDYRRALDRHRKIVEGLVGPGSEKKAFSLALALDAMLTDKGKDKERADYPNLTEFWSAGDPKVRTLRDDIQKLRDQAKYGDPFVVLRHFGKGKVVAVMTTAGKEWSDWGGGSDASLLYQPFIWEMQNYLSSQASDAYLTVGTPIQIVVDREQYKQKNRQLKMVRTFYRAQQGKPAEILHDSDQFGEQRKGELLFSFDKNLEPGLYVSRLVYEGAEKGSAPLNSWGHVFNVDTPNEGKLQRESYEEIDKNLVVPSAGKIKLESPQAGPDELTARESDLSESPLFFLFFLGVLVAEQALAVHLSFHLKGGEAEAPTTVPVRPARAA
jgi:hypothetical protein